MVSSIEQHRVAIGLYNCCGKSRKLNSAVFFWNFIFPNFVFCHLFLPGILLRHGDIEINPGPCQSETRSFEIGHVNARSLISLVDDPLDHGRKVSKFIILKNHITYHNYHIFGISETWLDYNIANKDLAIQGYCNPIRRDVSRHQCGVMVYIRKHIQAKRRSDIEPPNAEVICVELQLNKRKILICNCYRAPHFAMLDFCAILSTLVEENITEFKEIVFLGDINGRHSIFWNGDVTNTDGRQLQAFFLQYGFKNVIHEPTRISGHSRSCIDLIFSNSKLLIRGAGVRDKIVDVCDHCPIYASIRCNIKKT